MKANKILAADACNGPEGDQCVCTMHTGYPEGPSSRPSVPLKLMHERDSAR